jgi:predicted dehydrogenase
MEGQKSLFLPLTHEIRDMIQLGAIGDIIYIDSITAYPNIGHVTWFEDAEMGGGTLHLMGAYPFEYLPYLIGSEIVDCSGVARMFEGGTDSQSNFSIKFANGALANIFLTTHIDLPKELTIYGTKGKIVIPRFWGAQTASVEARACSAFEVTHKMDNEFIYEIKHVNECIREGKLQSDVMTEENTLTTIRIMEEFYKKW